MKTRESSRKFTDIQRGALEAAGLGEVAYFLKKARHQLDFAKFALRNIDFSRSEELIDSAQSRVDDIERIISEMNSDLQNAEQSALLAAEEREEESASQQK